MSWNRMRDKKFSWRSWKGQGGGGVRGRNKTSYDVLPWTIWITSGHLLIDKIVEDDLKTTDKTLQVFIDKNIGQQLK